MRTLESIWTWAIAHDWPAVLVALFMKGTVLLVSAWLLLRVWRGASAAVRHWVWLLALAGLFLVPLKFNQLPGWSVPLWSEPAQSANQILSVSGAAGGHAATPAPDVERAEALPARNNPAQPRPPMPSFALSFSTMLFLVWLVGAMGLIGSMALAQWRVRRLERMAMPMLDLDALTFLEEARTALRLRRKVRLLQCDDAWLPMTWGVWRPVVLLPAAAETWSTERRQIVLRHELGHIKRQDCLAQGIAQLACACFWFNPLAWLAARQMRLERERACDDLVLETGATPSSYAEHLLEIARSFKMEALSASAAIAIARPPHIAGRIAAIIAAGRNRGRVTARIAAASLALAVVLLGVLSACHLQPRSAATLTAKEMVAKFAHLQPYFAAKEQQARELLKAESPTNLPSPLIWKYFSAAADGDWISVTNYYWQMRSRAYQFEGVTNSDPGLENTAWQPVNETYGILGLDLFGNQADNVAFGRDVIASIPAGSIYFGGTDPGRWIITGLCKSHADADPFFTLSQNPLADGLYLKYLRTMYGGRIYTPTDEDSKAAFDEYTTDAQARMGKGQLRPGEDVRMVDGKVKTSGQVSVMAINALIAKKIFDKNPDREFYIEESFPLDWMYPHLMPNGLIMKLNRQPLAEIPDRVLRGDHDFWSGYIVRYLGDWLREDTSVAEICRRMEQTYAGKQIRRDSKPPFAVSFPSGLMFSKLRSSIAGVYMWRAIQPQSNPAEKQRMTREADFAFRQAYALAPHSPEALYRYVQLLVNNQRFDEALLLARTSSKIEPANAGLHNLVRELERLHASSTPPGDTRARNLPGVSGRVTLRGTPPPEKAIVMDAACAALNPNPVKTRHYLVSKDGGLANAFVYVKNGAPRGPVSGTAAISMTRCLFEPYVLGAQTGRPIELRNGDPVLDNIHVVPRNPGNRGRNIGMPSRGATATFSFDAPELFIRVKTDVHPWMFAFICVADHPWFAVTDKDGNFSLPPGLLPGHYTLAAAHPKAGEQTAEIEIDAAEKIAAVMFTLDVPRP